jgi:nucleotide-binding universal stress UspA family protein
MEVSSVKLERIACALDLSVEPSARVLDYALVLLSSQPSGELYLLHIVERSGLPLTRSRPEFFSEQTLRALEGLHDEYLSAAEQRLKEFEAWVRERGYRRVHCVFREGDNAAEEIVWFAESEKMDLIVMGTRGWTGMESVFLGSTAERVVKLSTRPVLVVPISDVSEAPEEPPSSGDSASESL